MENRFDSFVETAHMYENVERSLRNELRKGWDARMELLQMKACERAALLLRVASDFRIPVPGDDIEYKRIIRRLKQAKALTNPYRKSP